MNASQLQPASSLAKKFGVKSMLFGNPGVGKTPVSAGAPRPVMAVCEPGMLSMRNVSNVPVWEMSTPAKIKEFFEWFFKSNETRNFDTLIVDSFSQLAEIFLIEEESKVKHGMKAYGNMSRRVMEIANDLFYMQNKHIILNCKQMIVENGKQTVMQNGEITYEPVMQKRPFFPGRDLNTRLPHLFDNVLHMSEVIIAGNPKPQKAFRTVEIPEVFARSRIGNFNELEPADFKMLFNKAMSA